MAFFPDLAPLTNRINEFTQQQNLNQQQIIALLKSLSQQLQQIQQLLEREK
jgi:hypothetical protein